MEGRRTLRMEAIHILATIVAVVTVLAVDRQQRELKAESAEVSQEVHMLKTVARIAPQEEA